MKGLKIVALVMLPLILGVALAYANFGVSPRQSQEECGYGGPCPTPTTVVVQVPTAMPTATPVPPTATHVVPTATPTLPATPLADAGRGDQAPGETGNGTLGIPKLWGNAEVAVVPSQMDEKGLLKGPFGTVGIFSYGSVDAMFCHRDYVVNGKLRSDICFNLGLLEVGDRLIWDGQEFVVTQVLRVPASEWWETVRVMENSISTCSGVWDGKNYSDRVVVEFK